MTDELTLDIRPSPIAGTWYPGDAERIKREVAAYLQQSSQVRCEGEVKGLILPHAGWYYSGLTAAHALKAIEGHTYQRVIIVSPSHQGYRGHLLTTGHDAYQTPLGIIMVDHRSLSRLTDSLAKKQVVLNPIRNDREHAVEIELPFLQYLLDGQFELIPIMMMDQSLLVAQTLSDALLELINSYPQNEKTLLVASSDLSHFHDQHQANRLDQNLIEGLRDFDPAKFYKLKSNHNAEACGHAAMATVLLAARKLGANQVTIADYRTSGDVSGDLSSVVGYVSAILSTGNEVG
jgi:AmmeMemoRadiSam system protein B